MELLHDKLIRLRQEGYTEEEIWTIIDEDMKSEGYDEQN